MKTQEPINESLVNVCVATLATESKYSYSWREDYSDADILAFLFVNRLNQNWTHQRVLALLEHPDIYELFPHGCYAGCLKKIGATSDPFSILLITTQLNALPHPSTHTMDDVVYIRHPNCRTYYFTIADLWDSCLMLHKFNKCIQCPKKTICFSYVKPKNVRELIGTSTVPYHGHEFQLQLPLTDVLFHLTHDDYYGEDNDPHFRVEQFREQQTRRFKYWTHTIGGYVIVPAQAIEDNAVRPRNTMFSRIHHSYDFKNLEYAKEQLSVRAANGAATRDTKKRLCPQCYFRKTFRFTPHESVSCSEWGPRACIHGAWTQWEYLERALARVRDCLDTSSFSLEDVWRVAQLAGIPFKKKNEETGRDRQWVISQILETYDSSPSSKIKIKVRHNAIKNYSIEGFGTLQALLEFLPPDMQLRWDKANPSFEEHKESFVMWLNLSVLTCGKSYTFWFNSQKTSGIGNCTPSIHSVHWSPAEIKLVVQTTKRKQTHCFSNFADIRGYLNRIPLLSDLRPDELKTILRYNPG